MSEARPEQVEWGGARVSYSNVATGLITLGLALRLARYLQNYPFWCDETMLAANLLDRGWADLARPLDYRQVCPLGFLALSWAAVQGLGFSESSLRLVPILSALASVPLFFLLAKRVLGLGSTIGTVLAAGFFAVAQPPIRFAGEFKPYSTDLLAASGLLLLAILGRQDSGRSRWVWVLAAVSPVCVAVSLPSMFLIAAIAVVSLFDLAAGRRGSSIPAFAVFVATTGAAIAVMAALGQYHTTPEDRAYFLEFWSAAFPPSWNDPAALVSWLVRTHTGALFAYPHGPTRLPASVNVLVLACFVVGIASRLRRDRGVVALLLLPFLLTFSAAVIRRYPYGMSPRVSQFLVPSTLILTAAGVESLIARLRSAPLKRLTLSGLIGLMVALGVWHFALDLGRPYRAPWDRTAREFARWFWEEQSGEAELVCVLTDLGIPLRPERWLYDGTDQYLCYQRIYSRRHRLGLPPRWDAVSRSHPLRCVLLNKTPQAVPAFRAWLAANNHRYSLNNVRTYEATRGSPEEPAQVYIVCELIPASPEPAVATLRQSVGR